jgi:hypothetical protein
MSDDKFCEMIKQSVYLDKCAFSTIPLPSHIPLGFVNFFINILFRCGHGLSFALVTLAETFNNPFILHRIIQVDSVNQTLIQFKSHTPL